MKQRIKLGILTPSSNTALEPLTTSLINSLNAVLPSHQLSVHFSRFPVTTISLSPAGLAQFELQPILAAAQLLADAKVDVIGWSGTSSGWLGFKADVELCNSIEKTTGIKATTSVLALNRALQLWGVKILGLVTPYEYSVQQQIIRSYAAEGIRIEKDTNRHLGVVTNTEIAEIGEDVLDRLVEEVVDGGAEAVTTFCTNLVAAHRVSFWEGKHKVPVFDTVTTVVWDMLRMCELHVKTVEGWGMIFRRIDT